MNGWKVTAIIFIILFILENLFWGWAIWYGIQEEKKATECYYDVCENYEAFYDAGVCSCLELGENGYDVAKTTVIK